MDATASQLATRESEPSAKLSSVSERRIEELLRLHIGFVWRCLRRLGVAEKDADDATQRVFIVLSAQLERVDPGRERAFLLGTAVRVAANARRTARRTPEQHSEHLDELCIEFCDPQWLLERRRARSLLDELLEELSSEQRNVFVLMEIEGLTKPEVAIALQIPEGTVASRLRRAKAHLALRLEALRDDQRDGGNS